MIAKSSSSKHSMWAGRGANVRYYRWLCLLALIGMLLALSQRAVAAQSIDEQTLSGIDAYINRQMDDLRIPGLALAIVHGDQIVVAKGYGIANPQGVVVTPQMLFSIGSLTKSFTAIAIMQLVEDGTLELDAPVQRYLPWFQVADPVASASITLRHLVTHTSGLPRDLESSGKAEDATNPLRLEQRLRELNAMPLEVALGSYSYSNAGYMLLAMIIQQVTGQSYEAYLTTHVFEPLGMSQSFGSIDAARQAQPATGYRYWFGQPVAAAEPAYRSGPGNGGLYASVNDMGRYLIAQLNQGRLGNAAILSPAGMATLHQPAVERAGGWYAMGWGVSQTNGRTLLSHSGQTYNYFARMVLVPEQAWGVVVLQNSQYTVRLLAGDLRQDALADGVVSILLGETLVDPPSSSMFWLIYAGFGLLIVVQLAGIVRASRIRRRTQPAMRRSWWRIGLPLAGNLLWAGLMLLGLPAVVNLTEVGYQIPDLTAILLASGGLALGWSIIRIMWVVRANTNL
ncbi:serine hydrolase domain-containing protein [Herpetosiphon sp. NSE202]|uniref:serine hydrolase domain-containing protein n=1 Tax=Herpetosiphon sp. NSE202 TaxID=3351349 RepID=UPI0036436AED